MRREKLYKKSLLTCSDDFSYTQNEQFIYDSASFLHIEHNKKIFRRLFILHISQLEKKIKP
jgi:hypothetical protein